MAQYWAMFRLRFVAVSVLILAVCLFCVASASALQTLRYSIVSNGRNAGSEVDTFSANGHLDSTFEFNDRGRGPKIEARYVIDANSYPLRCDITGVDYLKAAVDEHFSLDAGTGRWKSTSEKGQAAAPGFYVSNNGPASEVALLVSALLKSNGAPLQLFPAGEARLEKMTDVTVESHGKKMHVTEYGITGLGFDPATVTCIFLP